jgi:hypothetical protein
MVPQDVCVHKAAEAEQVTAQQAPVCSVVFMLVASAEH